VLGVANPASEVSPASGPAWDAIAAVASGVQPGAPVAPGLVLGATDARWYSGRADAVYRFHPAIYTRADLSGFHGTNERLAIANLTRMAEGYARLILLTSGATAPPQG
jgi:carboxypeptidase PM20D1